MRRTVIWLLALVLVVLAGDRLGAFVFRRVLLRSQFRFSRVYRGDARADVVVLGDSRGVHSFYVPAIERFTGLRAFNLSYNSMTPPIAEALIADYLDRNPSPRLVLIEPTFVIVQSNLVSELRTYVGTSPRLAALYAQKHPRAAAAARVFHLLPYNSEFFLRSLMYFRRDDQDWIERGVLSPRLLRSNVPRYQPPPLPENAAALRRIVRSLRARGVDVRLVVAPYHRSSGLGADAVAASLGERVWNYAEAIDDARCFADTVHLNVDGSEAFLRMLLRDGVLPLRLGDGRQASSSASASRKDGDSQQ
jgi:hypothetical protein